MSHSQPTVKVLESGNIWTIENLFTQQECSEFIRGCESIGFEDAPFNSDMKKEVRNNDRVIADCPQYAQLFWQRVSPYLPQSASQLGNQVLNKGMTDGFNLLGFTNRLRFYRYNMGQYFAPHTDGCYFNDYDKKQLDQSFMTVLLYLNDVNDGGETNFLDSSSNMTKYSIKPRAGTVLVFVHWNCHEACQVTSPNAVKYVMRTDAIYRKMK